MRWQKKLTKELNHIKDTTSQGTVTEFWKNRDVQLADGWSCSQCQMIAKKLLARNAR